MEPLREQKESVPHFVLVPLFAQGHMIPMIDMARMIAKQGPMVTLITTPVNSLRSTSSIQRAVHSGLPIRVLEIPFPSQKFGIPDGCESLDKVPTPDLIENFYAAMKELKEPLEAYLGQHNPPPSCIISDKYITWTSETAKKFGIPRLVFHGMGCFSLLAAHNIKLYNSHNMVSSDSEPFPVPDFPTRVVITKALLPGALVTLPNLNDLRSQAQQAEEYSQGVVINSSYGLEKDFIESYRKAIHKKVWCIGPVSLCNSEVLDKLDRGSELPSINEMDRLLRFLEKMKPSSVIYACLGSQCRLVPSQLKELGLGLEDSNHPFIWVIKTEGQRQMEMEQWLFESGFESRVRGRGLVIKGWAPQVLILSHMAIRGFLTHCGWNSVIEGLSCGLPLITWPQFAEQFLNEKLVVEVLKVGVKVGVEKAVRWGDEERTGVLVRRVEVKKAVEELMGGGEDGEGRRRRARELGEMAKKGVEVGGSSNCDMLDLVHDMSMDNSSTRAKG